MGELGEVAGTVWDEVTGSGRHTEEQARRCVHP